MVGLIRRRAWMLAVMAGVAFSSLPLEASAVVLASQLLCQKSLSKAGQAYVKSTWKTRAACRRAESSGADAAACSSPTVVGALAKAASKFDSVVTKACSPLGAEGLAAPRPAGLGLEALPGLLESQRTRHDRLVAGAVALGDAQPPGSGAASSPAALACQAAIDRASLAHAAAVFKIVGAACHAREDMGRTVTGETSRLVEACVAASSALLDDAALSALPKLLASCSDAAVKEVGACPDLTTDRSAEAVARCALARARTVAIAAIAAEHGRAEPRVIGRVDAAAANETGRVAAADASIVLVDAAGRDLASRRADARGRVDIPAPPGERVTLCWQRDSARTCAAEPIDVGLDVAYFGSRLLDVPTEPGEVAVTGRLLAGDGSPCFVADVPGDLAIRGGVRVGPAGGAPGNERTPVSPGGDFVVAVPGQGSYALFADCGAATAVRDLGNAPEPGVPVQVAIENDPPANGSVAIADAHGETITDPAAVQPGDTLTLRASFSDNDPLEYRWEITKGDGQLAGAESTDGDRKRASGSEVQWTLDGAPVQEVTLWAADGRGGVANLVETIGPIGPGVLAQPCPLIPKLAKYLCGLGYDSAVPEPGGGRRNFLSYKFRNPSRNSAGDACLYYNVVDPECIDLDCDGIVDPGTDPLGKCQRTTLGGWWQKNGFDPVTGLGSDVVTAWYLNSNDLGFGREMHCRVTSWSSLIAIAERTAGAPTSETVFVDALRADLLKSPMLAQYSKLFGLYPSTVACYVTNYTTDHCNKYPTNAPANADLAYQGQQAIVANPAANPTNAYGTVAMEFGPVEGFADVGAITKFFVYNGRTASGQRLTAANLDGCGPKSVPEVCMSCHGGNWPGDWSQGSTLDNAVAGLAGMAGVLTGIDANDTAPTDAGYLLRRSLIEKLTREENGFSSFLPFDPDTYQFPTAASFTSQAASIRKLNQYVLYAKPTTAIADLIKGWYGNNLTSGTWAPWRPSAWNDNLSSPGDESDLYDLVYAKACRGCHAAHYSLDQPSYFPGSTRLCKDGFGAGGGSPTMPHAKLTYLNMWKGDYPQSPTMTALEAWLAATEMGFTSCD